MTNQLPLDSFLCSSLSGSAYFNCGNSPLLSFGGFAPYTVEAWVKPAVVSGGNAIFSHFNGGVAAEASFSITDGLVQSYRNVEPWVLNSQTAIQAGEWYYLATTYDGSTLSIYINGVLDSQTYFTSQPGFPDLDTLIGAQYNQGVPSSFFQGEIKQVTVWNVCRAASQIQADMQGVDAAAVGIVADYNFCVMPAVDQSANNLPITPVNNPGFVMETPALQLGGADYIDCGANPLLSFGGFLPYTFEGWINLGPTVTAGAILSRYDGGVAAEYLFGISAAGNVTSYRNVAPWLLTSNASLTANQWHHVATTYDGATLSIYIDGQLDSQMPFTSQPGFPDQDTLVGATFNQGAVSGYFTGYIENLRVWRFALNAADIVAAMNTPVTSAIGLNANLQFSVAPASDLTNQIALAPTPNAVIGAFDTPVTAAAQAETRLHAVSRGAPPPVTRVAKAA